MDVSKSEKFQETLSQTRDDNRKFISRRIFYFFLSIRCWAGHTAEECVKTELDGGRSHSSDPYLVTCCHLETIQKPPLSNKLSIGFKTGAIPK